MKPGCASGQFVEPDRDLSVVLQTIRLDGKIGRLFGDVMALSASLGAAVARSADR